MRALWKGVVIAESDDIVEVEGNHYFPPGSVNMDYLRPSDTRTACPWKGEASYYSVHAGGETSTDAAWYYPEPKDAAQHIKGRVAFWRGVEVRE